MKTTSVEVAVVGGGAAGIAAAVIAGRSGRDTLLLDERNSAGGTGGFSGLTTLCGLYDERGRPLNEGFVAEFVKALAESPPLQMGRLWVLLYRPERFRAVARDFLAATPRVQTCWGARLSEAVVEGGRIRSLNGVGVGAVIDCTGTAEVGRLIGAECLATDETTQASAVVFSLHGVTRAIDTPASAVQVLLPLARAGLPGIAFEPTLEPNTFTVKLAGAPEQVKPVLDFLRQEVKGFEQCWTPQTEFVVAQRAGRMILGQYVLTGGDVLAGRKFPDAVARCAWPIEQWNAAGTARWRYLPGGEYYEIPARALQAAGATNLFMAGKTISSDAEAIASARVMGCCLATGVAAGSLAAKSLEPRA